MKYRLFICTLLLLTGLSCGKEPPFGPGRAPKGVSVELQLCLQAPPTRSSFCPAELDRITDINVWIYRKGVLLEEHSFYSQIPQDGKLEILFPVAESSYDIYLLANTGEASGPILETDIGSASVSFENYSSFREKGFPMAGALMGFVPKGNACATLSRLVGRYDIQAFDNPSNTMVRYTFLSARMKSCAKTIRPFGQVEGETGYASRAVCASDITEDGDFLGAADLATLNAGGTVTLYYLENCQGLLLPDNDTQYGKSAEAVASATGDPARAGLCSYLELRCRALTPTAEYATVTYRAFLGRDAHSDFSVVRNTIHGFTLDMASNLIRADDWFVEPESPTLRAHMAVTVNPPVYSRNIASSGWNMASCPSCGALWGGDDFRFSLTGESALTPVCSCGWSGLEVTQEDFPLSEPLYLYDFLAADLYVSSDLSFGNTYYAYLTSTGSSIGSGFRVDRHRYSEAVDRLRITDLHETSANTLSDAPYSDTLVIASYDGLIQRKYKLYGITHAVPVGFRALGLDEETAGFRVFMDDNPAGLKIGFNLNSLTLQASSSATYNTGEDLFFRCSDTYDVPLAVMRNYVSTTWQDIPSISTGYRDKYGYIIGNLDVTGVIAVKPYVITGTVKLGIDRDTPFRTVSFQESGGIYDGCMGSSAEPSFYLNLYAPATGRMNHSSTAEGKGRIWTMFRLRSKYDGQYRDLREHSGDSRYWTCNE